MQVLRTFTGRFNGDARTQTLTELLYGNELPDWFIHYAGSDVWYHWNWQRILIDLRNRNFFIQSNSFQSHSVIGTSLSPVQKEQLGEGLIEKLAAIGTTLPNSEPLLRSLNLDGYDVNKETVTLIPSEGPTSIDEEDSVLKELINKSGLPHFTTILKHMDDAIFLYAQGEKDHASLGESRSLIQALIDGISIATDTYGKPPERVPGGMKNRVDYLQKVGFFTSDENAAVLSAWGMLSAGSHPGVPEREQARIGLILALEFGQLLLLKFANWKVNNCQCFS